MSYAVAVAEQFANKVEETFTSQVSTNSSEKMNLSADDQQTVNRIAKEIDISDVNAVFQYGAAPQKEISSFSDKVLGDIKTKDMGEVGSQLTELVAQLKGMNLDKKKKGFLGIKAKVSNQYAMLKSQYADAETNITQIVESLEKHQVELLEDIRLLNGLYELNQQYFKELNLYIVAGKEKIAECRNVILPHLQKKAQESDLPEDAQAVNDYANMIERFEKKIYDLELTKSLSIEMAPQIRLLQNNNTLMVEKIQTSIVNTIPLWKSQMVVALGLVHSQQAMAAQRAVTSITNDLIRRNSEILKDGSIGIAKESQRGIIELETLKQANSNLIAALEEVKTVQTDGEARRKAAAEELAKIENELKTKLLNLNKEA